MRARFRVMAKVKAMRSTRAGVAWHRLREPQAVGNLLAPSEDNMGSKRAGQGLKWQPRKSPAMPEALAQSQAPLQRAAVLRMQLLLL